MISHSRHSLNGRASLKGRPRANTQESDLDLGLEGAPLAHRSRSVLALSARCAVGDAEEPKAQASPTVYLSRGRSVTFQRTLQRVTGGQDGNDDGQMFSPRMAFNEHGVERPQEEHVILRSGDTELKVSIPQRQAPDHEGEPPAMPSTSARAAH